MLNLLGHVDEPAQTLAQCGEGLWYLSFTHDPKYKADEAPFIVHVLFEKRHGRSGICLFKDRDVALALQKQTPNDVSRADLWAIDNNLPYLEFTKPWPLEVHREPKPWGAELWYTGIEERGVCSVAGIPLPWLLQCLPTEHLGTSAQGSPLLLKILDPLPNPDLGDLYFELHDKKIEVYVVTHVDTAVWPEGVGKIRYGFNQDVRSSYPSDAAFKSAYLEAVESYQTCRTEIDQLLDERKLQNNIGPTSTVPVNLMADWLAEIPSDLNKREVELKNQMERFTHLRDIRVGDVIKVEPFFPHSLQHGVRVIEFQTASYERFILSFGQKVLTQGHWDTEQALESAILDLPNEDALTQEATEQGVSSETIADFSAFTASRLTIEAGQSIHLPRSSDYRLIICVSGQFKFEDDKLKPEQARFVPANLPASQLVLSCNEDSVLIIAEPKPQPTD